MDKCGVCGDGIVEENPGKCEICDCLFDSFCGDIQAGICEDCKKNS
jgi:hypothetical protein